MLKRGPPNKKAVAVSPLIELVCRTPPRGCEAALLELLPRALVGIIKSVPPGHLQRKIKEAIEHFLKVQGGRAALLRATTDTHFLRILLRDCVLPRVMQSAPSPGLSNLVVRSRAGASLEALQLLAEVLDTAPAAAVESELTDTVLNKARL